MFRPDNTPPDHGGEAWHIVFQRGALLCDLRDPGACLLAGPQIEACGWREQRRQFLGFWQEQPCYAIEIDEQDQPDPMQYTRGSLYHLLGRVDEALFALAGRAQQLLDWERDHQFCGRCGRAMRADPRERAMRCDPCRTISYPRIAPCVITLVTRGEELLLARNINFPQPMYSTLAGFIEAGENAEETVAREVREEVGVDVANLRYFGSQSWPFPNQLMLGFTADYAGGDILCDPTEIADARWFHCADLPLIPPAASISGRLIREYVRSVRGTAGD